MDEDGTDLPTDVLLDILQRIQPSDRRRLRHVCRHWRHVVDACTATSLRSPAKMLLVTTELAYHFDDLSTGPCSWERPSWLWPRRYSRNIEVAGTCNGIVCMCDNFGDILLYNPVTRDRLLVPHLPPHHRTGARTFSFTYDRVTRRYMIVHVPCSYGRLMVFTLGEAAWREIVIPPCHIYLRLDEGFVTIDNTMYWAERWEEKIMSFDLDGSRAPSLVPLPSPRLTGTCRLTEILGRLGIVFSCFSGKIDKMEVWVMERGASAEAKHTGWSRWYGVQIQRAPRHQPQWHDHQHLTWPHFSHGTSHVFTWKWLPTGGCALYLHMVSNDNTKTGHATVMIDERNQGTLVAHIETKYDIFQRFDYVKTMEPLKVYKRW